jgi:dTDP-3-amino-3,4,6-trideoxy-alpha-D-glucose transaminase
MIDFNDLKPLHAGLADEIQAAVRRVFERGWYVLGPEVEAFEAAFARYHGVPHAVGVASGTDALELALRAADIGPGDEVVTVAHTAVATVCAVERAGATPVLVDVDPDTGTMDPRAARAALTPRTRALLPVHLYGHPADLDALHELAARHHLLLVEDCAQAHGARHDGRLAGTVGDLGTFSFYPTKNLGACGDGGAVLTRDARLAERLRRLRNYGQEVRYQHLMRGVNSRLDELQAAILAVKLAHLDGHNAERRRLAAVYAQHLRGVRLPAEAGRGADVYPVYHLYVVRHPERDRLRESLRRRGVGTLVHYPVPVHRQPAYADLGYGPGSLPVTERLAAEVLSLPLYVGLRPDEVRAVAAAVADCLEEVRLAS